MLVIHLVLYQKALYLSTPNVGNDPRCVGELVVFAEPDGLAYLGKVLGDPGGPDQLTAALELGLKSTLFVPGIFTIFAHQSPLLFQETQGAP